ncbi:hypothetical protein [Agrococcus sp. SGAir0287]|uniref:hypothetical protein n=1 Tax=Agrococcus sp. SGAir0287 TaxID=2070347 RepID=UPI0010CD1E9D|nr:hypothetical protein [Agrococcus sp. SGAir0287]QCR20097.1 hypothetical protein C1N71_12140 [Agrococcus sp. SGAir0287]
MRLDIVPEALTRWVELPPVGTETPQWREELADGLLRTWQGDWSRDVAEDAIDHGLAARDPDALATMQLWPHDGPAHAIVQLSVHAAPPADRLVAEVFPGDDVEIARLEDARVGPGYEVVWAVALPDGAQGVAARHAFTDGETLLLVTLEVTHPLFAASVLETIRDLARGIVVEHDDGTPWRSAPLLEHVVVDEQVEAWGVVPIDTEERAS